MLTPANAMTDPASGYPVEGWNQEPEEGPLPAPVHTVDRHRRVAGVDGQHRRRLRGQSLHLSRVRRKTRLITDCRESTTTTSRTRGSAPKGCWRISFGFDSSQRMPPLSEIIEKQKFIDAFGEEKAVAIWKAPARKGLDCPPPRRPGSGHQTQRPIRNELFQRPAGALRG